MKYETLERTFRRAVCRTLGKRLKNADLWLHSEDPNEGMDDDELDLGTSVELCFEDRISPFTYFHSDVVFYATVHDDVGCGDLQIFFGNSCQDVSEAEMAAEEFLTREESDGWYVEEFFDEDGGLHLMRVFEYNPYDEEDLVRQISHCLDELLQSELANSLRSFIHYFED